MRNELSERVLVGGVGYRWMGDLSYGVVLGDVLAALSWPPQVEVRDLGYAAHWVVQDLEDADPPFDRLVLIAGVARGRKPGTLACERWKPGPYEPDDVQARMREAGFGAIDLDHLLAIARYFQVLPREVVLFEWEPVTTRGEYVSDEARDSLDAAAERVRREVLASLEPGCGPTEPLTAS
jgi:Ni,Fe-hydrogenase maturation factor